jgi:membrane protease YdiL (CAAX protease family)
MSNEKNPETKKCPQCSHVQPIEAQFCQKCGVSFTKDDDSSKPSGKAQWRLVKRHISREPLSPDQKQSPIVERTCSKCNTVIQSTVLEQCPLCMNELPPLPPVEKENLDRIFFTGKKLVSEKEDKIDPNKWSNGKEVINVFLSSTLIMIILSLGAMFLPTDLSFGNPLFGLIILIGTALLGIYPFIYISMNHLNWSKIGLKNNHIFLFIIIGIIAGVGMYFANVGVEFTAGYFPNFPEGTILAFFFNKPTIVSNGLINVNSTSFPIRAAIYAAFLCAQVFEEFLFRGVLHNGIFDVLTKKKKKLSRITAIILTSLIYCAFYLIFGSSGYASFLGLSGFLAYFEMSGYLLLFNFVLSLIVGIAYELTDRSMTVVITMKTVYVGVCILFTFIPLF